MKACWYGSTIGIITPISASSLHEDYHGPDDEADRLDYRNLEQLLRGLLRGVWLVAEREENLLARVRELERKALAEEAARREAEAAARQRAEQTGQRLQRSLAAETRERRQASLRLAQAYAEKARRMERQRRFAAARIFAACSSAGTTSLPRMCPQRFGHTWSSSSTPRAPMATSSRTMRWTLSGPP